MGTVPATRTLEADPWPVHAPEPHSLWPPQRVWTPPRLYLLVPGPLCPVCVDLDAWRQPKQILDFPRMGRSSRRGGSRFRRVDWPLRGPAVVWLGVRWVIHRPAPVQPEAGTPAGDLHLLLTPGLSDAARLAALERTVDRIPWAPRRPSVRRALAARAADAGAGSAETVKRQELRAAVYLVLAERKRPQTHRFGRAWVTDVDGRTTPVTPERLPPSLFWRWFCDEVRKAAEASLVGDAYPAERTGGDHAVVLPLSCQLAACPDPDADPLACLLAKERRREAARWWHVALGVATPRQRELLHSLAALAEAHPRLGAPEVSTLADAGKHVGMAPSTARVQWQRLVRRLRAIDEGAPGRAG